MVREKKGDRDDSEMNGDDDIDDDDEKNTAESFHRFRSIFVNWAESTICYKQRHLL
jgi:hypothetical protein